jgi:hypothetical protein
VFRKAEKRRFEDAGRHLWTHLSGSYVVGGDDYHLHGFSQNSARKRFRDSRGEVHYAATTITSFVDMVEAKSSVPWMGA